MYKSRLIEVEQDADGLLKVNGCFGAKSKETQRVKRHQNSD